MAEIPSSTTFDFNKNNYRLSGTLSWSISGTIVTWNVSYTTYEYVKWSNSVGKVVFQGLTNSTVSMIIGNTTVQNNNEYSGYEWGVGSSRTADGWQKVKTGTLKTTTTLTTNTVSVILKIEVPNATSTKTFTLAWNVTYSANGGTGTTATQMKKANQALTISANSFTRTNYVFLGWNTQADGSGTSVSPGFSYTNNAPLTLYAQWTEVNIPVYMNINNSIVQIEKAYYNDSGTIKECDIYLNDSGTLRLIK